MPKKKAGKTKKVISDDLGFWAAGPNSNVKYKVEDATWLHPNETMQDERESEVVVKSSKRKSQTDLEPVLSPPKSKKRKSSKKKKKSKDLPPPITSVEDVEELRDDYESNTEWNMRRSFLSEHMGTLSLDRLICLSKCFINYEIYGNVYPQEVMLRLSTMRVAIADVIPDMKERLKSKYEVQFVKSANPESKVSDSLYKQQKSPSKGMINFVKAGATYESINYAKSDPEDKSEESQSYHPGPTPCHKQGENFSDSTKPEEYGSLYDKMQGRVEIEQKEQNLSSMRTTLQKLDKSKPDANRVAKFFEACQKVKSVPLADSDLDPEGFSCKVFVDGILIAESIAKKKKTARTDAINLACEKILKPYHKLVGSHPGHLTFECSDQPFDSDKDKGRNNCVNGNSKELNENELDTGSDKPFDMEELKSIKKQLKDFYLRELNPETFNFPLNCMHQACDFLKVSSEFKSFNLKCGKVKCEMHINDVKCGTGVGDKSKEAEHAAAENALEKLRSVFWTMKYKSIVDTDDDKLSKDSVMEEKEKVSSEVEHGKKLGDSNIGSKLMKKMGWSGGGIGKNQQGREEPVLIDKVVKRSGLGADSKSSEKELKNVVFKIVNDYYQSNDDTDIAFAPDFSSAERKVIHDACRKFRLKSKSHGCGEDRYLVISRQRTPQELYQYVLSKGGETHKYKLIPPLLPEFK